IFSPICNSRFSKFCFQEPRRLPLHCHEDRSSQSIRTRYGGITHSVVMLQLECG
uniref:Uncharacterized protein n=1 Tax=Amphimedon queenslandica TaxID=400682 RepID=A0A1X7T516_AMPQE